MDNKGYFIEVRYGNALIGYLGTDPANESPRTRYKKPVIVLSPQRYRDYNIAEVIVNKALRHKNTKLQYSIIKPKSAITKVTLGVEYPRFRSSTKSRHLTNQVS